MGTVMELEDASRPGPRLRPPTTPPTASPAPPVIPPPSGARPASDQRELAWIAALKEELDEYYAVIRGYHSQEPDQVLLSVSAILSRLTGLRAQLWRDNGQRANALRTREVDPLIDALDLQFKIHSRCISMRELDFKVSGAQT